MTSLNRSRSASILKGGRKGSGIQGSLEFGPVLGLGSKQSSKVANDFGIIVRTEEDPADVAVTNVSYDNSQKQFTITKAPVGGSGSAIALGSIVGGNATPTTPVATADPDNTQFLLDEQGYTYDTAYPDARPFSFPLPVIINGLLRTVPRVKDWDKFTLDTTYSFGDKLPRCPDGLCYVRVERPYVLGDVSWKSAYNEGIYTPASEDFPQFIAAATGKSAFSTLYLYYDMDCTLNPVHQAIRVAAVSSIDDNARPAVGVVSYSLDASKRAVKVVLSRELDPLVENAAVSIPRATIRFGSGPVQQNPYTELDIIYSGDSFSICMGVNRNSIQGFGFGDLVMLKSTPLNIVDEIGVSMPCYEIIAPAGPAVPTHTHQNSGGGRTGGGHALFGS